MELKERRQAFVSEIDVFAVSTQVTNNLGPRLGDARCVAAYLPIGSEVDPQPLFASLAAQGVVIALPHVTARAALLRFLAWQPGSALEGGPFGLRQPPADAQEVAPDVILTPLLGFDAALNRIGYGAGHYDRAFARVPAARRIGLAWSAQACDAIPVDPWDVPLHAVATEQAWIER